ncbi:hypothetical protein SAMN05519104_7847 [Rhizobiales bacterium GAS188]|nr:hypothetical protein SAMN05519104_7847 [Rhizobiales bacterium GAS188]
MLTKFTVFVNAPAKTVNDIDVLLDSDRERVVFGHAANMLPAALGARHKIGLPYSNWDVWLYSELPLSRRCLPRP